MSDQSFDPLDLHTTGAVTLVLGQRTSGIKGHRIAMHTEVASELREICKATVDAVAQRTPVTYANDLVFDRQSQYLVVPRNTLVAHKPASRRGRWGPPDESRQIVEVDAASMKVLSEASSQNLLDASKLKGQSFAFYAAVVGDDPDDRTAYVSRWNPYKAALSGRLLASFGDRLRKVEGPLLAFERQFDLVVTSDSLAVLDPDAFEKVFRDIDAMRDRIPTWSDAVTKSLPVTDASAQVIADVCQKSSRVAKQARTIYERGLDDKRFTAMELLEEMKRQGLDHARLIKQGKLILTEEDVPDFLKLMDEKLYTGWHSGTGWDVGTRSARPH